MRSVEDKGCYNHAGPTQEISTSCAKSFDFHKGNVAMRNHRTTLGKPTPSKWDDAQKWLVGLSRVGEKNQSSKAKPRNSNVDDLRLIAPVPQKEHDYSSGEDEGEEKKDGYVVSGMTAQLEVETKKVHESAWRINKPLEYSTPVVRSICVRDMGTEMTPVASQKPSRIATPIRATTFAARSPIASGSSTPIRGNDTSREFGGDSNACNIPENKNSDLARTLNSLESRVVAWDEAERAKYMARYKHEEVKIQECENHEKKKVEIEMRKMEVKARAQERLANKLSATRRIVEEKRASAEAKLNEKVARTFVRADYIRTGHLPSTFSFKLPSLCW
ncbi:hypothetical protein I3842_05G111600 [Carya illinoinensis]|uniref:Remorin C-terminal domain-containing protein n=1 Tax=Carya illinoinensis TaxID=32201 RepID=A0A922JPT4_CARIL|nr:hypothetical protein I3842_05G111600 [Carya illinoinensis]